METLLTSKQVSNLLPTKPDNFNKWWLIGLLGVAALLFVPVFSLYFITADEELSKMGYLFQDFSWAKLQKVYSANNNQYNVLSFAFSHLLFKWFALQPKGYHVVSWLLHLANTGLVFYFVWLLTRRNIVAVASALLFALHPTHVESVAWILGQGELLATAFSLCSLIAYVNYVQNHQTKWLYSSLLAFILAVSFKFTALILPFLFLLIDRATNRHTQKGWTEKIPFLVISLATFGLWAMLQLKTNEKTFFGVPDYNFIDRIVLVFYTLSHYLQKIFLPIGLSAFYPYPAKTGLFLPWFCYVFALLPLVLLFGLAKLRQHTWVYWGGLFFLISLLLVSNLLPLGGRAFANDRQLYFASIGLFVAFGYGVDYWFANQSNYFKPILYALLAVVVVFAGLTYFQMQMWQNGITYWNNIVAQNPEHYHGHHKRGDIHATTEETYRQSMIDLNNATRIMPEDPDVWNSRAYIHLRIGDYIHAEEDLKKALSLNPRFAMAYFHLAHVHKGYSRFDEALKNYDLSIEHNPNFAPAYVNRGGILYGKKNYRAALGDYSKAIALDANNVEAYQNRGNTYYVLGDANNALKDYDKALALYPSNADVLFNRGMLKIAMGKGIDACIDFEIAKNLGNQQAGEMLKKSCQKK